jgi:hypothetical protein
MTWVENLGRFEVFAQSFMFHAGQSCSLLCRAERWGKMPSLSRHQNVTGSKRKSKRNHVSFVTWRIARGDVELKTSSLWFSLARNWRDRFLTTSRSNSRHHSVSARHFSQFLMLGWKFFSSLAPVVNFGQHGTSKVRRKPETNQNFSHRVMFYGLLFMGFPPRSLGVSK